MLKLIHILFVYEFEYVLDFYASVAFFGSLGVKMCKFKIELDLFP